MPTSAHWAAANSPKISVKTGTFCGRTESSAPTKYGESKTHGVGADDSVGPKCDEFAEKSRKSGASCAGRCRHRPLHPNAHAPADSPRISDDSVHPAGRSGATPLPAAFFRTENFRQDATLAEFLRVGKRSADADAARPTISCGGCYVYLATWAEMG